MGLFLKLLGLFDLLAAAMLFLAASHVIPGRFVFIVAAALVLKGFAFRGGPVSALDVIIGLYLLLTLATSWGLLNVLFGAYLGLKGLYSFV
jgi:hypothetical protein